MCRKKTHQIILVPKLKSSDCSRLASKLYTSASTKTDSSFSMDNSRLWNYQLYHQSHRGGQNDQAFTRPRPGKVNFHLLGRLPSGCILATTGLMHICTANSDCRFHERAHVSQKTNLQNISFKVAIGSTEKRKLAQLFGKVDDLRHPTLSPRQSWKCKNGKWEIYVCIVIICPPPPPKRKHTKI